MRRLSPSGQQAINDIAQRHGFSVEATLVMLDAIVRGHGAMAQFSHPEFGGPGQWMRGGMTMVGDMNDHQLKGWVDALCQDLAHLVATQPDLSRPAGAEPGRGAGRSSGFGHSGFGNSGFGHSSFGHSGFGNSGFAPSGPGDLFMPGSRHPDEWWPAEFGTPTASGSQNGARYAYFAGPRRLAVEADGRTTVYDTGQHVIRGVSQQQPGTSGLAFTSQHGVVDLSTLAVVSGDSPRAAAARGAAPPQPPMPAHDADAVFRAIERLAALKDKGILSDEEFAAKKAELLRRV